MAITVKFFASLREQTGISEQIVDQSKIDTVAEIWSRTTNNADLPPNTLVAINMDYVDMSHPVNDGDEVAFFPPVTGG
jgi:molybdopterin synthase sulfur carrier subunit